MKPTASEVNGTKHVIQEKFSIKISDKENVAQIVLNVELSKDGIPGKKSLVDWLDVGTPISQMSFQIDSGQIALSVNEVTTARVSANHTAFSKVSVWNSVLVMWPTFFIKVGCLSTNDISNKTMKRLKLTRYCLFCKKHI